MRDLPVDLLLTKVATLYAENISHRAIAGLMTDDDILPPWGEAAWTWQTVDKLLVLAASRRRALARTPAPAPLAAMEEM